MSNDRNYIYNKTAKPLATAVSALYHDQGITCSISQSSKTLNLSLIHRDPNVVEETTKALKTLLLSTFEITTLPEHDNLTIPLTPELESKVEQFALAHKEVIAKRAAHDVAEAIEKYKTLPPEALLACTRAAREATQTPEMEVWRNLPSTHDLAQVQHHGATHNSHADLAR